jgi:G3E family GTPase
MKTHEPIPVTILTGFLGAGKTTLLNHLLSQPHGRRCAIIINEFGAISIDHQLVINTDEEVVELSNGCICCRVRKDLVTTLVGLFQKQKRFDYVLIETTGLADPSPLAHTFALPDLKKRLRLDAIVTVVDARNVEKELADAPETMAQIAFADVLLLNKSDLVPADALAQLERHLTHINPLARIHRTERSKIDVAKLLDIKAREVTAPLELHDAHDHDHDHHHDHDHDHACHDPHCHDHDHDHAHDHDHEHHDDAPAAAHDDRVRSFSFTENSPLDLKKTEAWLSTLLRESGQNIYRCKGILNIRGEAKRVVFQGVQMDFESTSDRLWKPAEPRVSQLVFIGKELDETAIRSGFAECLVRV